MKYDKNGNRRGEAVVDEGAKAEFTPSLNISRHNGEKLNLPEFMKKLNGETFESFEKAVKSLALREINGPEDVMAVLMGENKTGKLLI